MIAGAGGVVNPQWTAAQSSGGMKFDTVLREGDQTQGGHTLYDLIHMGSPEANATELCTLNGQRLIL